MKTFVSLIPDDEHAVHARAALQDAGIPQEGISTLVEPADVWARLEGHQRLRVVRRSAAIGAALGLSVSAIYAVPLVLTFCPEMGCSLGTSVIGFVILAIYWLLGGAFLGTLVGADRLEQGLYSYVEGVRRGGRLMVVDTPDERADEVPQILEHDNGLLVYSLERRDG
jgi:hypothetical protein